MSSAVPAAGCGLGDLSCQCGPTAAAIALLVGPCLLRTCDADDLSALSSAESAACSSFSAGKLASLPVAAATTTGTSTEPPTSRTTATATDGGVTTTSTASEVDSAGEDQITAGAKAAFALGAVVAALLGFGFVYALRSRWRRAAREAELAARERPAVDELAEWARDSGDGDEEGGVYYEKRKRRFRSVDVTSQRGEARELEVPVAVYELPGSMLRHELAPGRMN